MKKQRRNKKYKKPENNGIYQFYNGAGDEISTIKLTHPMKEFIIELCTNSSDTMYIVDQQHRIKYLVGGYQVESFKVEISLGKLSIFILSKNSLNYEIKVKKSHLQTIYYRFINGSDVTDMNRELISEAKHLKKIFNIH